MCSFLWHILQSVGRNGKVRTNNTFLNPGQLYKQPLLQWDPQRGKVILNPVLGIYACSVQFSSVAQSCLNLGDPINRSTPGLPVHQQLPEFTQTHIHRVGDAIHPSISSSVIPFSSCSQSLPASRSFPVSQLFT